MGNGGRRRAVGGEGGEGLGGVLRGWSWHARDVGARTVGDGQGTWLGDRVGVVSLRNNSWCWAVGCVGVNGLGGSNPDRWDPRSIARWSDISVGNTGRGWDWGGSDVGARTVSDGKCLTGSGSVGLGALREGGSLRAESGPDISSESSRDNSAIPVLSPSLGGGDEAKDGHDSLEGLHLAGSGSRSDLCNESGFDGRTTVGMELMD